MTPPDINQSTKEQREKYVRDAWRCLNDCEACGKCRILRGRDPETLYTDYINGIREYIEITFQLRNSNY
jgi:hypothetical protein